MKNLALSSDVSVPIDVVTEKLAWIGVTGSGKSYGAGKLAELMWDARAQFVILDPVGIHYGLRLAGDGKGAGIPIPVFGGLHGDVPLDPTAGALVADLIVDRDLSAVVDVSQFESDSDKARFVSAFADRVYQRRKRAPAAIHIFLEEAQEFAPQNPQPGEQLMLHHVHRLQKLGRNFGIGTSIITQRPQETSKKALNQAQTVFMFRLTGSQERKAMEAWITDKGLDREMADGLPSIKTGDCHVWSPAWLRLFRMTRISAKRTFDASATPKVGDRSASRTIAPIDLDRLREDMAAIIERARESDPVALRHEVDVLRREKAGLEAQIRRAAAKTAQQPAVFGGAHDRMMRNAVVGLKRSVAAVLAALDAPGAGKPVPGRPDAHAGLLELGKIRARCGPIVFHPSDGDSRSSPHRQAAGAGRSGRLRMLRVLASRHPVGLGRHQLATLSGMSPGSGTFGNYLSEMRRDGQVCEVGGEICLTGTGEDAGREWIGRAQSVDEVRAMWRGSLGGTEWRMLESLISQGPASRAELAARVGLVISGTFGNYLSTLRRNGLISESGGEVWANRELMGGSGHE